MAENDTTTQDLTDDQKLGLAAIALLAPVLGGAVGGKDGAMMGASLGFTGAGKALGDIGEQRHKERQKELEAQKAEADYEKRRRDRVDDAIEINRDEEILRQLNENDEKPAKPVKNALGQVIDANTGKVIDANKTPSKSPAAKSSGGGSKGGKEGASKSPTSTQLKKQGLAEIGEIAEAQYDAAVAKGKSDGTYNPTDPKQVIDNSARVPEFTKSDAANEAYAAASSWIDSYLRDESGAAIPADEKANYYKTYFPQPGDTEQTVANKAALRQQKMRNARSAGGGAASAAGEPDKEALKAAAAAELQRRRDAAKGGK